VNARTYKAAVLLSVAAVLVVGSAWRLHGRPSVAPAPADAEVAEAAIPVTSSGPEAPAEAGAAAAATEAAEESTPEPAASASSTKPTPEYPAVIDLGMGKCIPCKQMKPILDELKGEYSGRCRVEIIDIGERPEQADKYGVQLIPTQVFFDRGGQETYRHEGFMPKADNVAKMKAMGVE